MNLILLALAPVVVILLYVYFRDKYEKEPVWLLLKGLIGGGVIVLPIIFVEMWLSRYTPMRNDLTYAGWTAFVVAGFTEEFFKYLILVLLFWRARAFNEKFDGIVYAVFVSLGFAAVENVMYVWEGGATIGWLRAFTAVPAHAMFGIIMGFYLGIAKFNGARRAWYLLLALAMPILFHGIYDFLLMTDRAWMALLEIPFILFMLRLSIIRMRRQVKESPFNPELNAGHEKEQES